MFKSIKKRLKDQRGLTLVELLAVIVILGIIAGIAVPNIGGIIDNSKKDAHVANAQQMVSAARLAVASNETLQTGIAYLPLAYLEGQNFLETVEDPDNGSYNKGSNAYATTGFDGSAATSYVKVDSGKVIMVKIVNGTRGVQTSSKVGVAPKDLNRSFVINN
ncbi:type II secretion system protein [Bacillus sp. CGMCC 1.16607]|uniref:type II secretion system protein n=1 Tax=Bacillus sp. CGMCC 1.16607 TaxID=3351842 RepID=UPI00363E9E90